MTDIVVLFARRDSVYKTLSCDVYDKERDAHSVMQGGGRPVIAHPPCAQWGTLRHMAHDRPAEKRLALFAVCIVRAFGGVLEHPKRSTLWHAAHLPVPGAKPDAFGGWTLAVSQKWWGHRAEKQTLLYIVGCRPSDIPPIPFDMRQPSALCGASGKRKNGRRITGVPEISKSDRERTPLAFAEWLIELANRCALPGCNLVSHAKNQATACSEAA